MTDEDAAPEGRVWASKWYRITPRSFIHEELFFDPDEIVRVVAGESYKSFLLRRDGREEYAAELGEEYRELPASRILAEEDNEAITVGDLEAIRLATGSLFRKPKLVVVAADREHEYYHPSRKHDVEPLGERLAEQYPSVSVTIDGEKA